MGDFLMQPPVITMLAFILICIILLVGIAVMLRTSRSNQQAGKKAATQPSPSRPSVPNPEPFNMPRSTADNYDPLTDLYADDDDEEVADLASLLSGMGEEKVHTVAASQVSVRLDSGETTQARELLSVLRDAKDGRLMILSGDTAYRTLLNDPEVKKQFTTIMKELSAVILKPDDGSTVSDTVSEEAAQPAPATTTQKAEETPIVENQPPLIDKPVTETVKTA